MNLIRWNPMLSSPVRGARLHDEIDRLFDGVFHGVGQDLERATTWAPAADVEETADAFAVRVDLPGLTQKDVKVSLLDDTLTIRGERKIEKESKDRSFHRVERRYGSFERSFTFGIPVQGDAVSATVRDGVLEVHVPKAEQAKVRDIEIKVAS